MMFRTLAFAAALFAPAAALAAPPPPPVQVMIVGDFHMSNPGHDLHNVQVDDVLAPKPQAEIRGALDGLARFRPTVVVAEWDAATVADRYPKYLAGTAPPSRNEVVQLGFGLARLAHARMIGIDVDGGFPYEAVQAAAAAGGQQALLTAAEDDVQAMVATQEQTLRGHGVSATLRFLNDPRRLAGDNAFYRTTLRIGAGDKQPGADLLTAWYRRNFLICANLIQAAKPGDRMVVFYGSGHAFLLRQCVQETPGFQLVEPNAYLPK
jgi:hypothetical protein